MADILTCQRTGEPNVANDGSSPSSVPVNHASELEYPMPAPWNYSSSKWNAVALNVINYACAFPAMTCKNVCCEKGLFFL